MSSGDVKYCQNCGSKNPIEQKFCGECGKTFNGSTKEKMSTEQKTGMAQGIISFVLSLFGLSCLPFLGSIAAVITGFMTADRKTNNFAKAGIIIGFVGISLGIIGILIGIYAALA